MSPSPGSRSRPSLGRAFAAGIGLQFLAAAPAAILQAVREGYPLFAPLGLPVLVGGRSVVRLFEATVQRVCGERHDTMLSNAWWFFALAAAQALLIAVFLAWRRRRTGRWLEPWALGTLAFLLANATLAADWPWWGT